MINFFRLLILFVDSLTFIKSLISFFMLPLLINTRGLYLYFVFIIIVQFRLIFLAGIDILLCSNCSVRVLVGLTTTKFAFLFDCAGHNEKAIQCDLGLSEQAREVLQSDRN